MAQRHKDAFEMQTHGACNPCGIANAIVRACKEVHAEQGSTRTDPAVRLMVHQLAYLCDVAAIDRLNDAYPNLMRMCEEKAKEDETIKV